jgi:tetratricopeptide (TPR) repeat protein
MKRPKGFALPSRNSKWIILLVALSGLACWTRGESPRAGPYDDYRPAFLDYVQSGPHAIRDLRIDEERLKRSREKHFYSLCLLEESSRANAIVHTAMEREAKGATREALQLYQRAIRDFPDALFRVSPYGVFVPIADLCQARLLMLPEQDRAYYRTTYDAEAREFFQSAKKHYSLMGYQTVLDRMLATSYGDDALLALGDAALDAGDYEEALDRYTRLRRLFAGLDCDTPELALKVEVCRKRLARTVTDGLVTHQGVVLLCRLEKSHFRSAGLSRRTAAERQSASGSTTNLR